MRMASVLQDLALKADLGSEPGFLISYLCVCGQVLNPRLFSLVHNVGLMVCAPWDCVRSTLLYAFYGVFFIPGFIHSLIHSFLPLLL